MSHTSPYSDGFFHVSKKHGFLPISDPLTHLPPQYAELQLIMDKMYVYQPDGSKGYLAIPNKIEGVVAKDLPNFLSLVSKETDPVVLQALYRAYTFLTSAYTLEKSYQVFVRSGNYGEARRVLPANIAEPLVHVSEKLDVFPWLDYHYAYSLGNYVKKNSRGDLHWSNLDMACKFTGLSDETGFIMLHVYINELSPYLVGSVFDFWERPTDSSSLESLAKVMKYMNSRRKEMWQASRPEHYNDFRVFIMGIKGNDSIFGPGLIYENCFRNEPQQFRGQTGAQDNIIPTLDIFCGIVDYYPENELTKYLLDLRQYRPKCVQRFFTDLREHFTKKPVLTSLLENKDANGIVNLLQVVDEVYLFRNGHWQFVQKYIMSNTRYAFATGGTPITSWLINQIECVLEYERVLIEKVEDLAVPLSKQMEPVFDSLKIGYGNKLDLLKAQVEELKKINYNIQFIYNKNKDFRLQDSP